MSTNKPFRCGNPECPDTTIYSELTKPICPVCGSGKKVMALANIHIHTEKDDQGNPIALCGVAKATYATSVPSAATCFDCLAMSTGPEELSE